MSPLPPDDYPVTCPRCAKVEGYPKAVSTDGPNFVKVVVRCQGCEHQWMQRKPSEPLFKPGSRPD